MRWPFRRRDQPPGPHLPHARPIATPDDADQDADAIDLATLAGLFFVCSQCGRSDLAPAGDWDPPICEECDAAINFDAILEELDEEDEEDD